MGMASFLQGNKSGIDLIGTALGGGLQAAGQFGSGFDASSEGAYKASVLANNAAIANMNAQAALERGRVAAGERDVQTAQTIGEQKANLAAHGVVVNQDTGLAINVDAARLGKLDEQQIIANANREALAYKMQGINFSMEAKAARKSGSNGLLAGLIGGGASLLSTATKVATKWSVYSKDLTGDTAHQNVLGY